MNNTFAHALIGISKSPLPPTKTFWAPEVQKTRQSSLAEEVTFSLNLSERISTCSDASIFLRHPATTIGSTCSLLKPSLCLFAWENSLLSFHCTLIHPPSVPLPNKTPPKKGSVGSLPLILLWSRTAAGVKVKKANLRSKNLQGTLQILVRSVLLNCKYDRSCKILKMGSTDPNADASRNRSHKQSTPRRSTQNGKI